MAKKINFAFLDSGTGGIPYMHKLKEKRPECTCVYLGDTIHFPYGEKTPEEVTECSAKAIDQIIKKWDPETIVIACNTISVTALTELRKLFPQIPIVGTVPAIKLASSVTKNKNIGLLATNATVNHPYCQKLIEDFAKDCHVYSRGDPDLISFIEHDYFTASKEERLAACKSAVDYFHSCNCDTIILGCTHFCHMASEIAEVAGPHVMVIDSRDGVSNQALKVEMEKELSPDNNNESKVDLSDFKDTSFFVTGLSGKEDEEEYKTLCENFNIPWGGLI